LKKSVEQSRFEQMDFEQFTLTQQNKQNSPFFLCTEN
jgi:hypothetical protein